MGEKYHMKKYIRMLKIILRNCIEKNITYRFEFVTGFLTDLCFCFIRILFVEIIFTNIDQIGSWNRESFMLFFGTSFIIEGIYMFLFFNGHTSIPKQVSKGDLDMVFVKPVSEIFYLSLNSMNLGSGLSNCCVGLTYLLCGLAESGVQVTGKQIGCYIFMLILGVIIYFWMSFIINILSFWIIDVNSIFNVFTNVTDFYRYPGDIFGSKINFLITFVLPFQLIAIIPTKVLINPADMMWLIASILMAVVISIIGNVIYSKAKKAYVGSNC